MVEYKMKGDLQPVGLNLVESQANNREEEITMVENQDYEEYSYVPSHFGDIMSQSDTTNILQGDFSPIERIFLSANGNLQRLLSSYYNQKIYIEFVKNIEKFDDVNDLKTYDREVNLCCKSELVCNAVSTITVTDKKIRKLIESGEVGIGQVFRYLSILPNFKLIWIKRKLNNQQLIRQYTLSIPGFECLITETFHPEFLSLKF